MASLTRSTKATYTIHEKVTVNTSDREEHTFCGIMFPIQCKEVLPIDHIMITSISIRGGLGPLTIWVTKEDTNNTVLDTDPSNWYKIYNETHKPNFRCFVSLDLSEPIALKPGEIKGVYIHSTLPGDQAIVYDNHYGSMNKSDTPEDSIVKIHPAVAHVSEAPFGTIPIWGWGNAWRTNRKFVGRISYGIVYKLWHPNNFNIYGTKFQNLVHLLLLCQRRSESPISKLPDDCIFYILHLCKWDWMDDCYCEMEYSFLNRYMLDQQRQINVSSASNSSRYVAAAATAHCNSSSMDQDSDDSSSSDDDDGEWSENNEDGDDEEYYEEFINHITDSHARNVNNRARHHHEPSIHTVLFEKKNIEAEYKEKYYINHTKVNAANDGGGNDDEHQDNRRSMSDSVRNVLFNRNIRNRNPIGLHYFTMMRRGGGDTDSRSVTTRRRGINNENDDTTSTATSNNNHT